jgi:hypothetical protein
MWSWREEGEILARDMLRICFSKALEATRQHKHGSRETAVLRRRLIIRFVILPVMRPPALPLHDPALVELDGYGGQGGAECC